MNEHSDLLPNLHHEEFEMQMRGYSRRQVDEYVARRTTEIRDLEQRLAHALDEAEDLRREISTVRQQALAGRPAHEEVSERIAQILKLAEDEAKAQRSKTDEEITGLRSEAQRESERLRTDAREQAERMLNAAQEQAERTISAARAESEKMRSTARTEADRLVSEARKESDSALDEAKAQAKRLLDEATARASAIHDGAERRLTVLSTRHAETVRRLNDILEGVQGLVSAESARPTLEDEVNQSASAAIAALEPAKPVIGTGTTPAASGDPAGERDRTELPAARALPIHPVTVHPELLSDAPDTGSDHVSGTAEESAPPGPSAPAGTPGSARTPGPSDETVSGASGGESVLRPPPYMPGSTRTPGAPGTFPGPPSTGRHATPPPAMPRRLGPPTSESPRNSPPIPSSLPLPGPAQVIGSDSERSGYESQETRRTGRGGLIDPDEPAEGIRLIR